jgi:hypothetical protein
MRAIPGWSFGLQLCRAVLLVSYGHQASKMIERESVLITVHFEFAS